MGSGRVRDQADAGVRTGVLFDRGDQFGQCLVPTREEPTPRRGTGGVIGLKFNGALNLITLNSLVVLACRS